MSDAFPVGRWRSRWVWSSPTPIGFEGIRPTVDRERARSETLLRRNWTLDTIPEVVPARCTADSRYVLWVNGHEVTRGPGRGHWTRLHADHLDLSPYLSPGDNTLAVLARHYGRANPWWMPASPTYGLGGGAFTLEARADDDWLVTDASWRARTSERWMVSDDRGIGGQPAEIVDARRVDAGWNEPEYDDTDWSPAIELATNHVGWPGHHHPPAAPYGALTPSPLPPLRGRDMGAQPIAVARVARVGDLHRDPVQQVAADEARVEDWEPVSDGPVELESTDDTVRLLLVDLGEQTAGHVEVQLDAPEGAVIDARVAEALDATGRLVPLEQHNGFRYIARGADDGFESFDRIGMRFVEFAVRSPGPVTLQSVSCRERLRPHPDGAAFASSDPTLDRIWAIGVRTVDLCAQDAYLDCPSREQRAWTGDAVVHQMVDFTTNPDWTLPLWNLEVGASRRADGMLPMAAGGDLEAANGDFIPDWALHWIHALHNAWRYRGDANAVAALLPIAEGVLRWFEPYQGPDGLLHDVTGWVIIDWSAVSTSGTSGALNALWARGLREFAEISAWLGDAHRARWAQGRFDQVRDGFDGLWDPQRDIYVDHALDGVRQPPLSQHTNAAAVAAGIVPSERASIIVDAICDHDRIVHAAWLAPGREATLQGEGNMYAGFDYLVGGTPDPWWDVQHQIVAAQPFFRYVVHDAVAAAGQARRIPALCRDWDALLEPDTTTWRETWFGGSHCHGWSSTPTRDLVQYTLGVTPAEPGFARARVAPSLGDLDHVSGSVPTPAGFLHIEVDAHTLRIDSPIGTVIEFCGHTFERPPGRHEFGVGA